MIASDVVKQLWAFVPLFTDLFTDQLSVTSITSAGTTATVTTAVAHGLSNGDVALIIGARVQNPITTLTQIDNVATATTTFPHDLTEGFSGTRIDPLTVEGATEPEYDGSHPLIKVIDQFNFTYQITGDPSSPATGSPILLEDLQFGYNGLFNVTVTSTTTFTYVLPQALPSPAGGTIVCSVRPRISALISQDRAAEVYTRKETDELWAFVVLGNRVANNDRTTTTDAINSISRGSDFRQLILQNVAIYLYTPASSQLAAREARDQANNLAEVFSRALLRTRLPSEFVEPAYSGLVFEGDNFAAYNGAVYVHEYLFEATEYITYDDTNVPDLGVPFREIDLTYVSSFNGKDIMTDKITLD